MAFEASAFHVLNQRAIIAYHGGMNSGNFQTASGSVSRPLMPYGPAGRLFQKPLERMIRCGHCRHSLQWHQCLHRPRPGRDHLER
jgi:hypothetical protein